MRLNSVMLKNYKCFEELEVDLEPDFTVLVGENAAGKTALLDGVAIGLGAFFLGIPIEDVKGLGIHHEDVRSVSYEHGRYVDFQSQFPCVVRCSGVIGKASKSIRWSRELNTEKSRTTRKNAGRISKKAHSLYQDVAKGKTIGLPVIAYYGTQRLWKAKRDTADTWRMSSRWIGYLDCLDPASNQKHLVEWMRQQTLADVQEGSRTSLQIKAVSRAVEGVMGDVSRVYYSIRRNELMIGWSNGSEQPFAQLSDGYRNLLAMVADLAWRAVVLNPGYGSEAAKKVCGVALIDELELHLHPRLQRTIVSDLRRVFPGVQFIATTHSPQIIGGVAPECLRVMDCGHGVSTVGHSLGLDANTVLETIMGAGARDAETQRLLDELADAIDEEDWSVAKKQLSILESRLGVSATELVHARWEIEFSGNDDVEED